MSGPARRTGMIEVSKRWTFDAAHQLPNHQGKCRNLHGHTYAVEITCRGMVTAQPGASDEGMLIDFGELSAWWKRDMEPMLDHQYLNETVPVEYQPTTAENIAAWICDWARVSFPRVDGELVSLPLFEVASVAVWETPTSKAVAS